MFKKTKEKLLTVLAVALALVLAAPVLLPQTTLVAQAESKPTVYLNGYGFLQPDLQWTLGINETVKVVVDNKKAKASYSFSSSSKSVATVSKKGVITGKKVGTAKITVTQKYKGKTTKIGTVKIRVKKAKLCARGRYWVSAQPGFISKNNPHKIQKPEEQVEYRNPDAKYAYYSDSKDLVISKDGVITQVKKAGKANLIIKETYKGKTSTIGKIPIVLKAPTYNGEDTVLLYVGEIYNSKGDVGVDITHSEGIPNLQAVGKSYFCYSEKVMSDEEILEVANGDRDSGDVIDSQMGLKMIRDKKGIWNGMLLAQSVGTHNCAVVQWNYLEKRYDKVFARFKIVVKEASTITNLQFSWERKAELYDYDKDNYTYDKNTNTVNTYLYANDWEAEDNCKGGIDLFVKQIPFVYYGEYKVTSSDPNVVSVTLEDYPVGMNPGIIEYAENRHEEGIFLNLGFHKTGQSTITVEAGGVTKSFVVNVTDDEE